MGKHDKFSIPENMSFEPDVIRRNIEELERIAAMGKLSCSGYSQLTLLKDYEEFQTEKSKKEK